MTVTVCEPVSNFSIGLLVAGRERDRGVARLEDGAGRELDLLAGLDVDCEPTSSRLIVGSSTSSMTIALVAASRSAITVVCWGTWTASERRRDRLDRGGQVGASSPVTEWPTAEPDEHEAEGDRRGWPASSFLSRRCHQRRASTAAGAVDGSGRRRAAVAGDELRRRRGHGPIMP